MKKTAISASIFLALSLAASVSAYAAYPLAKINNRTPYPATGTIHYLGPSWMCKNDDFSVPAGKLEKNGSMTAGFWQARSRGVCLIKRIDATLVGANKSVTVTAYTSSGTSYSNFIIQPTQTDFRVYSDHELARETASATAGKSPGFRIQNNTLWPISVALEQVGCLYYQTLRPGQVFDRNTGAVWFTITASISPNGSEPRTDMTCIKPVAIAVGFAVVGAAGAALTVISGGTALPAAGSAAAALAPIATSSAVTITGAMIAGGVGGAATGLGAKKLLMEEFAAKVGEHLAATSHGSWWGQYAGPEWPFRCDQKPTYVITGGWGRAGVDKDENFSIEKGVPLRLTKTNGCGNAMMAFTRDMVSSPPLPRPNVPPQILPKVDELPPAQNVGLTAAAVVGNYVHTPPPNAGYAQNDWHIGAIVQDANGLRWSNKAGSVWQLTPDLPNLKLHTGPDNPYYAQGYRDIDVVVSNGQLYGLRINGALYARTR